jgi:hypothetical protein
MLTEKDYCDYETCIALKELGYSESFPLSKDYEVLGKDYDILLYEAQKWLREEKKLFVEITIEAFDQTYLWEIYNTENSILIAFGDSSHNTYEEALSEGVREAVKLLKEK